MTKETFRITSKVSFWLVTILSLIGFSDSVYLTANHYLGTPVQCFIVSGCEKVLSSTYSSFAGIPLSVLGLIFYASVFIILNALDIYKNEVFKKFLKLAGATGFVVSMVLLYLQIFVIKALCIYCLTSMVSSTLIFITVFLEYNKDDNIVE